MRWKTHRQGSPYESLALTAPDTADGPTATVSARINSWLAATLRRLAAPAGPRACSAGSRGPGEKPSTSVFERPRPIPARLDPGCHDDRAIALALAVNALLDRGADGPRFAVVGPDDLPDLKGLMRTELGDSVLDGTALARRLRW